MPLMQALAMDRVVLATSHGQAHTELIEVAFRNDGRMLGMKVGEIQEARSRKDGIELGEKLF